MTSVKESFRLLNFQSKLSLLSSVMYDTGVGPLPPCGGLRARERRFTWKIVVGLQRGKTVCETMVFEDGIGITVSFSLFSMLKSWQKRKNLLMAYLHWPKTHVRFWGREFGKLYVRTQELGQLALRNAMGHSEPVLERSRQSSSWNPKTPRFLGSRNP